MIGLALAATVLAPPAISLKSGLVINRSVRVRPGTYRIGSREESGRKGANRAAKARSRSEATT